MDTLTLNPVLLALLLSAVTYAIIYLLQKGKAESKQKGLQVALSQSAGMPQPAPPSYNLIPPAIPEPGLELHFEEPEEDNLEGWELVEDDTSILLKEAETVTEQISAVVAHIASDPPNPTEVYTKIKAIVGKYKIFEGTEFYDAINRYVAVTVERDLKLSFSEQQLQELWN